MSSTDSVNNLNLETTVVKEKKPRAPTLPAKFSKFIHFAFYLTNKINDSAALDGIDPPIDSSIVFDAVKLFADVDTQRDTIQEFFDASPDNKKALRKLIADQKKAAAKANKEPKEKKPRAPRKKSTDTDPVDSNETIPKVKKSRAKKPKADIQDDFVADMVSLATNSAPINNSSENVVMEILHTDDSTQKPLKDNNSNAKTKSKAKAKANKDKDPPAANDNQPTKENKVPDQPTKENKVPPANDKKSTKDKKVPATKEKKVPATKEKKVSVAKEKEEVQEDELLDDDNEEEVVVDTLDYNGTTFLVDSNNVVFDFDTHEVIGALKNGKVLLN
jgi:hypothetical protein